MKKTLPKNVQPDTPIVELSNLVMDYGDSKVLDGLDLKINQGEFVTILGASGSGKTTALRLIAGLEWPTRGKIKFDGIDVKDLPPHRRFTNTIFQDYALFLHLSVSGNIKYGLNLMRVPKKGASKKYQSKLTKLKKQWNQKANLKLKEVLSKQAKYKQIKENSRSKSHEWNRAQKKLDDLDFLVSYWHNYETKKETAFKKRYTTRKMTKQEIDKAISDAISLVGLQGNETKNVSELSGGMKQRVAVARAIVLKPKVLLLDEPLAALDLKIRQSMQRELKAIQRKLNITFIFVTHDQEEAMTMSDRIAVMRDGKVEQFDHPQQVYDYPVNSWVASFVGDSTIFDGVYTQKGEVKMLNKTFKTEPYRIMPKTKVKLMLRPEDFELTNEKGAFLKGKILKRTFQGAMWEYQIQVAKNKTIIMETNRKKEINDQVFIKWNPEDLHVMEK